jgi:hypothetical protein
MNSVEKALERMVFDENTNTYYTQDGLQNPSVDVQHMLIKNAIYNPNTGVFDMQKLTSYLSILQNIQ